jgi:hypothetical protein
MIVIRIIGDALGRSTPFDGKFVKSFDPDAHRGRGAVVAVLEPLDALRFTTTAEAHSFWRYGLMESPTVRLLRITLKSLLSKKPCYHVQMNVSFEHGKDKE